MAPWQSLLRSVRGPPPSQMRPHRSTARIAGKTLRLLRGHRACHAGARFCVDEVVAGERHRLLIPSDLDLEDHLVHVAEGDFTAGKIKLPHAAEAIVVTRHLFDGLAVRWKTLAPVAQ